MFDKSDLMRTVRLRPYRKGMGPTFTLKLWYLGGPRIGYQLLQHEAGKTTVLFEGDDFRPSIFHSIDGDDAVKSLLGFLTVRPGDTDADYFKDYTPTQLEYCQQHAENLGMEVYNRFGE